MCGIIGYIGEREAKPIILAGLKRMEYRGYDSAGIATYEEIPANGKGSHGALVVNKKKGKLGALEELVRNIPLGGTMGIGHTRWATHGAPNDINSHPHVDQDERIALIHNGIIENYSSIKERL